MKTNWQDKESKRQEKTRNKRGNINELRENSRKGMMMMYGNQNLRWLFFHTQITQFNGVFIRMAIKTASVRGECSFAATNA